MRKLVKLAPRTHPCRLARCHLVALLAGGVLSDPRQVSRVRQLVGWLERFCRVRQLLGWLGLWALSVLRAAVPRAVLAPCAARDTCLMDSDDVLTEIMYQLVRGCSNPHAAANALATISPVSWRFARLAKLDLFWRPIALQRWHCQHDEATYLQAAAEAAAVALLPGTAAAGTWREHFRRREDDLVLDFPVFFMGSELYPAQPIGLHLFEPRYRRLIQVAMARDERFIFAMRPPKAGLETWLCECHSVSIYPDGRADLYALPALRCRVLKAWQEEVSNVPKLHWARVELLPWTDNEMRLSRRRALQIVRAKLGETRLDHYDEEEDEELDEDEDEDEDEGEYEGEYEDDEEQEEGEDDEASEEAEEDGEGEEEREAVGDGDGAIDRAEWKAGLARDDLMAKAQRLDGSVHDEVGDDMEEGGDEERGDNEHDGEDEDGVAVAETGASEGREEGRERPDQASDDDDDEEAASGSPSNEHANERLEAVSVDDDVECVPVDPSRSEKSDV